MTENASGLDLSNRTSYDEIRKLQEEFSKRVIDRDNFDRNIEFICGVDVSYRKKPHTVQRL